MKKHLVLAGGGHAHLTVIMNLKEYIDSGHRVSLISPSSYLYYSGMGPGMLSGLYEPAETRFHIRKMAEDRGAVFLEDTVAGIVPAERTLVLKSGGRLHYDVVSFNIGSEIRKDDIVLNGGNIVSVKPVENLLQARRFILEFWKDRDIHILVIGGGPAGLEISGNVWKLLRDTKSGGKITLICGGMILEGFPGKARTKALESLRERGITVIENVYLQSLGEGRAFLSSGATCVFDIAFLATGVKPPDLFRESALDTGSDGGLLVNEYLQSVSRAEIFGGGDCISFRDNPLPKVGVHAVRESSILHHNLQVMLGGGNLMRYQPRRHYMLIFNLGNGRGLLWRRSLVSEGRAALWLKNFIDRKFMRKYQVSGEPDER
ncbi:MAG: NAD(P)/FAD-dependent oxidoreductase [Nitrospirota bacterium]